MLHPGRASALTAELTLDLAVTFGRSILRRVDAYWAAAEFTAGRLDELIEAMLWMARSLIVGPGRAPQRNRVVS